MVSCISSSFSSYDSMNHNLTIFWNEPLALSQRKSWTGNPGTASSLRNWTSQMQHLLFILKKPKKPMIFMPVLWFCRGLTWYLNFRIGNSEGFLQDWSGRGLSETGLIITCLSHFELSCSLTLNFQWGDAVPSLSLISQCFSSSSAGFPHCLCASFAQQQGRAGQLLKLGWDAT